MKIGVKAFVEDEIAILETKIAFLEAKLQIWLKYAAELGEIEREIA